MPIREAIGVYFGIKGLLSPGTKGEFKRKVVRIVPLDPASHAVAG